MFDPFQPVPKSISAPLEVSPPKSLLPQLPPNNYDGNLPVVNKQDMFDHFLNTGFDNSAVYQYGFEQEKRYSNPYLQFNPRPMGGVDTEDIYGKFQGSGEQLWNALIKTGATALSSFVSGFGSFGDSIDAIRGGKPFGENSILGESQSWLNELENKYPNYYTSWERDHPWLSAVNPTGFVNFWGDKILKNAGFTAGSLASAFLIDAGIELATGGGATPASFILAAQQLKKAISPLKNAFRSLSKLSTLNKVDDLMGVARVGEGITGGLKTMNQAYNLKRGLQFAGTTYFAAQGESMIEGYQQYYQTKADLYKQELDKGTLTPEKISEIENIAQEVGNTTTVLNLPIIMASNLLQFPTIFGGRNILKQFESPFLDVVRKDGLTVVNNYTRKQAWVNTMKEFSKEFVTEGGEEGYQYYVGNSIHDYYIDKFNGTATLSLSEFLGKQLPKQINDEQFWENAIIGGSSGVLMGGLHTIKTNLIGANERAERARQTLQPVYNRFNSTVKDYVHFAENLEFSSDDNKVNQFQTSHKALYSTVHDSLKYGIFENFQDNLEDLKQLPVEEYNKMFGTKFNDSEKFKHINSLQAESLKIKNDLTQVEKFFQKNPFDSPYVNQRLRDIYKVDQTQVEDIKRKLFDDFKELVGYNIGRIRNTRTQLSNLEDELKMIGFEDSIIPILYNLDSPEGINQYKKFKAIQLGAIQDEIKYYQTLDQKQPDLILKEKSLEKLIKELDKVTPEKFRELIFQEELGDKQLAKEKEIQDKIEELRQQQDIAVKASEDLEGQTTKPEEKVKEQVETLSKIVPPEPKPVKKPEINKEKVFTNNFGPLTPGDQFNLKLVTEDGTFTVISKTPLIATKEGSTYQFYPDKVIKNGEEVLRYALENIGVEKVESVQPLPDKERFEQILSKIRNAEQLSKEEQEVVIDNMDEFSKANREWKEQISFPKPEIKSQVISTNQKEKKKIISEQERIKEKVDKAKTQSTSPVKDGIYLLEGDNKFAWRYVDDNTAVPLTLKLENGKLVYEGDMTKGVDKRITEGYLLDDQYIEEKGIDITPLLEELVFGSDITELLKQESEETQKEKLSLSELASRLKQKESEQKSNLDKFLTKQVSDSLKTILEWRLGKGINVKC